MLMSSKRDTNSNENFSGTTNYVYGSSQLWCFISLGDITCTDRSRGDAIVNLTSETWFRIEQSFETSLIVLVINLIML